MLTESVVRWCVGVSRDGGSVGGGEGGGCGGGAGEEGSEPGSEGDHASVPGQGRRLLWVLLFALVVVVCSGC
eukprot:1921759-Rhodomonas_salina.1